MSILLGFVASAVTAMSPVDLKKDDFAQIAQFPVIEEVIFQDGVASVRKNYQFQRTAEQVAQNPVETMQDIARARILQRWEKRQAYKLKTLPKELFTANVSAYTAAADECGKSDGITASGVKVKEKTTLACPPEYPFGTKVYFQGIGTFVCEDRGGAIKGSKFDIYVQTKSEAFSFGRQNLTAKVVL